MKMLSISDVRNHLPSLLEEVATGGETLIVTRYGRGIASIVPFQKQKASETRYPLRNRQIAMAKDFDVPMPEMWEALTVKEHRSEYEARRNRGQLKVKKRVKK